MHPTLYTNVTRQITRPSSSDLQSADTAPVILSAVSRDLFRSEITWGKVHALYWKFVLLKCKEKIISYNIPYNYSIEIYFIKFVSIFSILNTN